MANKAIRDKNKRSRAGFQGSLTKLFNATDEAISLVRAIPRDFANFTNLIQGLKDRLDQTRDAYDKLHDANQAVLDYWDESQGPDPEQDYMDDFATRWGELQRLANKALEDYRKRRAEEEEADNPPQPTPSPQGQQSPSPTAQVATATETQVSQNDPMTSMGAPGATWQPSFGIPWWQT